MNKETWNKVMELGQIQEPYDDKNKLKRDEVQTIIASMDYFAATDTWIRQTLFDLTIPKFRVFDWLAMCIMSRNDDDRKQNETALKVLVHAYIKTNGIIADFIADLRETDYECDREWKDIKIGE